MKFAQACRPALITASRKTGGHTPPQLVELKMHGSLSRTSPVTWLRADRGSRRGQRMLRRDSYGTDWKDESIRAAQTRV